MSFTNGAKWLPLLLMTLSALPAAFAQETTAGFQGTVKDATGASIPGAVLEVSGPALLGTRKIQADDAGTYRFAAPAARQITR